MTQFWLRIEPIIFPTMPSGCTVRYVTDADFGFIYLSNFFGVDTKQRLSKQRHHKTATVTIQRLLQNSDNYKTATITKQRKII